MFPDAKSEIFSPYGTVNIVPVMESRVLHRSDRYKAGRKGNELQVKTCSTAQRSWERKEYKGRNAWRVTRMKCKSANKKGRGGDEATNCGGGNSEPKTTLVNNDSHGRVRCGCPE